MKLSDVAPSQNFDDRTGWSPQRQSLHNLAMMFDPMRAGYNAKRWLQVHNVLPLPPVWTWDRPR